MEEQTLTLGTQYSAPGNSLPFITLCASEWGIFRSRRGGDRETGIVSFPQEDPPRAPGANSSPQASAAEPAPHKLLQPAAAAVQVVEQCWRMTCNLVRHPKPAPHCIDGARDHLHVTCVAPFPLGNPNATAAFRGFPLISCFQ